ncbi:uncharacterized mitochondrial protein-like protein, partial [Tanacetum coccineum]
MQGEGPEWLFDLDYLTNSMNYKPVIAENQANNTAGSKEANDSAGLKQTVDAEHARTMLADKEVIDADELARLQNQEKEACDAADVIRRAFEQKSYDQGGTPISSSTKTFSPVHTRDFKDDMVEGAVADNNNMDTSNVVSFIPTTRVHSFHPKTQIIGDPSSAVQTRSRIEPKKISEALDDESWIKAMQEELLQFKIQKVRKLFMDYTKLLELEAWYATLSTFLLKSGYRRETIDKTLFIKKDKTLFIKKDKKDIMLVQVYVDDIIFGSTKKSWCDEFKALMKSRFHMSSMGELTFFLGLQVKQKEDGIFFSQDKFVAEILKKFDFENVKTASTPIETQKPPVKDEEAADVDVHFYRSMIGSLM